MKSPQNADFVEESNLHVFDFRDETHFLKDEACVKKNMILAVIYSSSGLQYLVPGTNQQSGSLKNFPKIAFVGQSLASRVLGWSLQ